MEQSDASALRRLASAFGAALSQAGAEMAERLGVPVEAVVGPGRPFDREQLAAYDDGPCLLVTGQLAGAVGGSIGFLVRKDDARRLAAQAEQAGDDAAAERGEEALSEKDTAAVVFVLAQIGAAATAVWQGGPSGGVRWPSEAAELTPGLVDMAQGADPLFEALGAGDVLVGLAVRFAEPLDVELLALVSSQVADGLADAADEQAVAPPHGEQPPDLSRLLPVAVTATMVLARRRVALGELMQLTPGHVLDLQKQCDGDVELYVGEKLVARGEVVTVNQHFAFRVAQLVGASTGSAGPEPVDEQGETPPIAL